MPQVKIALFQNDSVPLDPAAQTEALKSAAREAAGQGAQLLITPELFMSGYYIPGQAQHIAESVGGPFLTSVAEIARSVNMAILAGYPEHAARGVYNSAALVSAGGELLINHRKLHLSGAYEKTEFITDNNQVQLAEVAGIRVAPLICYDVEFPEAVRSAALKGAHLIAVPTALVAEYDFLTRTLIPTRAFENGLFVAYVNHAATESNLTYCGLSTFAGPFGRFQQTAGAGEELLIVTLDTDEIIRARSRLPYLDDRRSDLI